MPRSGYVFIKIKINFRNDDEAVQLDKNKFNAVQLAPAGVTSMNQITKSGFYYLASSIQDTPSGGYCLLIYLIGDSGGKYQWVAPIAGTIPVIYYRKSMNSTTWGSWYHITFSQ